MTFPEWTKPGICGAIAGAVLVSIVGFNAGGWVTGSTATKMAEAQAREEVTLAMVPVCIDNAAADPERAAKMATIREAAGYSRFKSVMEAGWATPPGTDAPDMALARACVDGLNVDAS